MKLRFMNTADSPLTRTLKAAAKTLTARDLKLLKNIIITRTIKDKLRLKWNAIGGERKVAGQDATPYAS